MVAAIRNQADVFQKSLEKELIFTENVDEFLKEMDKFLNENGNPNYLFETFSIGENQYQNVTCFHITYIYWKNKHVKWKKDIHQQFSIIFNRMLNDQRTNLRARFSEVLLFEGTHFFNYSGDDEASSIYGFLGERMTIAHYATLAGDITTLEVIFRLAPDLFNTPCCLVKGKNLLQNQIVWISSLKEAMDQKVEADLYEFTGENTRALQNLDDEICGEIATATFDVEDEILFCVSRIAKVSLFHLAAGLGDEMLCEYFRGKNLNWLVRDSNNFFPSDYLNRSIHEGIIKETQQVVRLLERLEIKDQAERPLSSHLPRASYYLPRNGHDILYDSRSKIPIFAYQVLEKSTLEKNVSRMSSSFKVDFELPKENRARSDDYKHSGFARGHNVPAADATSSKEALKDTFFLSNISPQVPEFNNGRWKELEGKIRQLANNNKVIEVFTGGLFIPQEDGEKKRISYEVIGKSNIAVPTHFFKVIYFNRTKRNLAYILPNENTKEPLEKFQKSVSLVQELSGIIFSEWEAERKWH